jgi:hypothetical protein
MASLTFTPIVPTLAGTAFTMTAVVSSPDEYDYIPINDMMRTVVAITNSNSSSRTVTFTSQKDQWGNSGACMDKAITVPGNKTVITGVWLRSRWGNKAAPGKNSCTVTCSVPADISMAVINVPNASI